MAEVWNRHSDLRLPFPDLDTTRLQLSAVADRAGRGTGGGARGAARGS